MAARALLAARPDLDFTVIAVQRMILDPESALMTSKRHRYLYERAGDASGRSSR